MRGTMQPEPSPNETDNPETTEDVPREVDSSQGWWRPPDRTILVVLQYGHRPWFERLVTELNVVGYKVLTALGSLAALILFEEYPGPIHLVIETSPAAHGPEMERCMRKVRGDFEVLYMASVQQHLLVDRGRLEPGCNFINVSFEVLEAGQLFFWTPSGQKIHFTPPQYSAYCETWSCFVETFLQRVRQLLDGVPSGGGRKITSPIIPFQSGPHGDLVDIPEWNWASSSIIIDVSGIVKNLCDKPMKRIRIHVVLRASNGALLKTGVCSASAPVLPPREETTWSGPILTDNLGDVKSVDIKNILWGWDD